jgi:CheY-like chemotaxis protein
MNGHMNTILVIEDSDDVRETMVAMLETSGYRVLEASEAETAFELTRRASPQLIVTDIMLGTTTGLDLITRIRSELPHTQVPPIVACSGFPDVEEEALRRGAIAFLPKPFGSAELLEVVREALSGTSPASSQREHLREGAASQRRQASAAAASLLSALSDRPDMVARSRWGVDWLKRYFGFGEAFTAMLEQDRLCVVAATDEQMLALGHAVERELPVCRDILETSSSISVADAELALRRAGRVGERPIRYFIGVPYLAPQGLAIGVIGFYDHQPRSVDVEELCILQHLGRVASARLATLRGGRPVEPFFAAEAVLGEDGFRDLLGIELHRGRRRGDFIEIAVARLARDWSDAAAPHGVPPLPARTALGALGSRGLTLFTAAESGEAASSAMRDAVESLRPVGVDGVGVLALSAFDVPSLTEHDAIRWAEALSAQSTPAEPIHRVALRTEAWPQAQPQP